MWEGQLAQLATTHRVVSWDWRGVGASDKPRGGYTAETVARDLNALIEHIDAGPVVSIGHGIGSHATLMAAVNRPDQVSKMILASTAPWFSGDRGVAGGMSDEFIAWWRDVTVGTEGRGSFYGTAFAELGANWLFHETPHPAVLHSVLDQALSWPHFVANAYIADFSRIDNEPIFDRVIFPTRIIQGRHDRKQRYEGAVYLARRIPGAELHTLEHSAHMGHLEEPNRFNQLIREFAA